MQMPQTEAKYMAGTTTNLFRELFSRTPTVANEIAAKTKTALESAMEAHNEAMEKFKEVVGITEHKNGKEP